MAGNGVVVDVDELAAVVRGEVTDRWDHVTPALDG